MKGVHWLALSSVASGDMGPIEVTSRTSVCVVQRASICNSDMGDQIAAVWVISSAVFVHIASTVPEIGESELSQEVGEGSVGDAKDAIELYALIAVFDGVVGRFDETESTHCEFDTG